MNYKNEKLNDIAKIHPNIDFSDIDDKFVVRVGAICEKLGLEVIFKNLGDGHSGYFESKTKTIVINDHYPATRNLFTVAHEIGHYILHNGTNNRFDSYHQYTPEENKMEREANNFAASLLMPSYKFIEMFNKFHANILEISDVFGVSQRATEIRAFNLGLIDNI